MGQQESGSTMEMHAKPIQRFVTSGGARVYQIPLQAFPGLSGWVYLVLAEGEAGERYRVLIDAGSGFGEANAQLEAGLDEVTKMVGEPTRLEDLTHILITHGHIDHFGGLTHIHERTKAQIGVHELDRRILTNYEERLAVAGRRLSEFLVEAGVPDERRKYLIDLYLITKSLYHSVPVNFTYEAVGMRLGPFEMLHVPGHCAGHVVIRLHDILFSGDHILEHTSPHQSPEHLTLSTGLDHYFQSLEKLRHWVGGIRLTLGGHERPITDVEARIEEIRQLHNDRLEKTLAALEEPHTVAEVSKALFGEVHGYNVLLAMEEAGAHVEYLYQRGALGIANLEDLEQRGAVPIQYYRLLDIIKD